MKKIFKIFGVLGLFLSLFVNNPATHVEIDSQSIENLKHCGATGIDPFDGDSDPKDQKTTLDPQSATNNKSVELG